MLFRGHTPLSERTPFGSREWHLRRVLIEEDLFSFGIVEILFRMLIVMQVSSRPGLDRCHFSLTNARGADDERQETASCERGCCFRWRSGYRTRCTIQCTRIFMLGRKRSLTHRSAPHSACMLASTYLSAAIYSSASEEAIQSECTNRVPTSATLQISRLTAA